MKYDSNYYQGRSGHVASGVYSAIVNMLPKNKNLRILDAGSGKAILAKLMKEKKYKKIDCLDIYKHFKDNDFNFILADLNKVLPIKDNTYDVITCSEVIEHIENPRHLFREFNRILKKGGILIISTPNILHITSRIRFLLTGKFWGFSEKDYKKSGHITPVSLIDLKRIINEIGSFKIEEVNYNKGVLIFPYIKIPFIKSLLFGEIIILKLRKIK